MHDYSSVKSLATTLANCIITLTSICVLRLHYSNYRILQYIANHSRWKSFMVFADGSVP